MGNIYRSIVHNGFSYARSSIPDDHALDSICLTEHNHPITWKVIFDPAFEQEFDALPLDVQDELLAHAKVLETFGPSLGRPRVDTLKGSRHANMKELRFSVADGVWRVAFAFDPVRRAVLLTAASKSGINERRFYQRLIETADRRFGRHLNQL